MASFGAEDISADATGDANGALLLRVLIPQLWNRLDGEDRRELRACCREARRITTCAAEKLAMNWHSLDSRAEVDNAIAGLRSLLAGGCRPSRMDLVFCNWHKPFARASKTAFGLRLLAELRAVPALALTVLKLTRLPLTATVVRAIAAVAPRLSNLSLQGYSLSRCTGQPGSLPFSPTLSGVQGVLRLAAPHLQRLSLVQLTTLASAPAPTAAVHWHGLALLLLRCSRLEKLSLTSSSALPPNIVSGLAQLPALRSLKVALPSAPQVPGSEPTALPSLPSMTQLTRLALHSRATYGLPGVLSAVAGMRGLADLQLPYYQLRPVHLRQLAALTALTRLHVEGVWATDEDAPAGDAVAGGSLPGPAALPLVPLVPLPAQLHALVLTNAASPHAVAALGLPPGPVRLQLPGLVVPKGSTDADGRLSSLAAEALLAACRQLGGRLCKCDKELPPQAEAAQGYWQPFCLDLGDAAAHASWPDRYGTLFAALQPLGLRDLSVASVRLTVTDVDALVRHLPLLQNLELQCAVELPSLPLLCGLKHLEELQLYPGAGGLVEGWDSELALKSALLVLCADAPRLTELLLWISLAQQDHMWVAAGQAMDWLAGELLTLMDAALIPSLSVLDLEDDG